MTAMTTRDLQHVFESLRKGLVPERGIDAFAVGIEKLRGEMSRQLDLADGWRGNHQVPPWWLRVRQDLHGPTRRIGCARETICYQLCGRLG